MAVDVACLEVVSRYPLPAPLEWATDVRWSDAEMAFVAALHAGVYRVDLDDASRPPEVVVRQGDGHAEIFIPGDVALSDGELVVASPVFMLGWKNTETPGGLLEHAHPFAAILDVDVHRGDLLVLGAQYDDAGRFASDGNVAWAGSLEPLLPDLQPILASAGGPGAPDLDGCGLMELGVVRFRPDGSFVVVPGFEEGVLLYGPDRTVARTWTSRDVGFDAGCGVSEDEKLELSVNEPLRWSWVNRRRTVDEVLPLPDSIGVFVREARDGGTRWRLSRLRVHGGTLVSCEVPIEAPSNLAHLRADVRGDEVLLLVTHDGYTQDTPRPPAPPELVRLRYRP